MPRSPGGPVEKEDAKIRRACVWRCLQPQGKEIITVVIVSILLPITIDLALRSSAQGCVKVSRMREHGILLWVAAAPISVVGDAEIKDQAPGAGLVPEVVSDFNVAAPLRIACAPCVPRS